MFSVFHTASPKLSPNATSTTLGTFSTSLVDDLDADGAPNGNQSNFLNLPRTPGGAVSVQALGYFNPYGINSYWHPNDQYGFDITLDNLINHPEYKNNISPPSEVMIYKS